MLFHFGYGVLVNFSGFAVLRLHAPDTSFPHFLVTAYVCIREFPLDDDADAQ